MVSILLIIILVHLVGAVIAMDKDWNFVDAMMWPFIIGGCYD